MDGISTHIILRSCFSGLPGDRRDVVTGEKLRSAPQLPDDGTTKRSQGCTLPDEDDG